MTNQQHTSPRTWLITGASSGIGLALAHAAAERGDQIVAVARRVDSLAPLVAASDGRVLATVADVNDPVAIADAVSAAVDTFGRIDVVANSAGYGLFGGVEEAGDDQVRAIFDTNVHGTLNVLRAALPVLRGQGSGHVLQFSSFLGQTTSPGLGFVSATKYAIEALSDALADELEPTGVRVTIVEPGLTATPFSANLVAASTAIADYDPTVRETQKALANTPPSALNDPGRVAAAIIGAVDAEQAPRRLATGSFALSAMRAALTTRLAQLDATAHLSEQVDAVPAAS